jgi:hypothetical protein
VLKLGRFWCGGGAWNAGPRGWQPSSHGGTAIASAQAPEASHRQSSSWDCSTRSAKRRESRDVRGLSNVLLIAGQVASADPTHHRTVAIRADESRAERAAGAPGRRQAAPAVAVSAKTTASTASTASSPFIGARSITGEVKPPSTAENPPLPRRVHTEDRGDLFVTAPRGFDWLPIRPVSSKLPLAPVE